MQSQIDAICSLLKGGHYDFILSLLETSFVPKDVFFEVIKQCCDYTQERLLNIPTIMELHDDYFDDQDVVDHLFTMFVRNCHNVEKNIDLFKRMIDQGAKIKCIENSAITSLTSDLFFYYTERNDTDINLYMRSAVYHHFHGHIPVYDWIFERWMLEDVEYDLLWFCDIAKNTYVMSQKWYFAQVMTKLGEKIDQHIILFYLCCFCYDGSEDLLTYALDCKYTEEISFFRSLMLLRYKDRILDNETVRVGSFIEDNEDAKRISDEVYRVYYGDVMNEYENTIPKLTELVEMMKIAN